MNYRRGALFAFVIASASSFGALSFPAPAQACGFIACVSDIVVPGSGRVLDGVHEALGKPLDTPIGRPAPAPAPGYAPQQAAMGFFCRNGGQRSDPGPVQPVGSVCYANGPLGSFQGWVSQF